MGISEIYHSCNNLFSQLLYIYRNIQKNKQTCKKLTVVSMLSCSALERSNNPFIESIVEPCVSKSQKKILAMSVWMGRESEKGLKQWEKVSISWKRNLCISVCKCVCKRKKLAALKLL